MRESEPWRLNILPLRLPNRAAIQRAKVPGQHSAAISASITGSFDSTGTRRARSQLSSDAVHADCGGVGMDVASPRL